MNINGSAKFSDSVAETAQSSGVDLTMVARRWESALQALPDPLLLVDGRGRIVFANNALARRLTDTAYKLIGQNGHQAVCDPEHGPDDCPLMRIPSEQIVGSQVLRGRRSQLCSTPLADAGGTPWGVLHVWQDTARVEALETQLAQARKLEAIGQLTAGIAHEINTPSQFIGDNLHFLRDGFAVLADVLGKLAPPPGQADSDLAYYLKEIPLAISQALEGVEQVTKIARAMKEFSFPNTEEKINVDLNRVIESTITVCRNEWKYAAEVVLNLDPAMPPVPCYAGQLNQVILNLVTNAAHAIAAKNQPDAPKGTITINTSVDERWAQVSISDTGTGIPDEVRSRIFEPFFTTKALGKGTGQGLPISRRIVEEKHSGTLGFQTNLGEGTTFIIRLPRQDPAIANIQPEETQCPAPNA